MRMQMTMLANTNTFWYALYEGQESGVDEDGFYTGEPELKYSDPVKYRGNISPNKGIVDTQGFGSNVDYDNVLVMDIDAPRLTENSVLWVGIDPLIEKGKATVPYNYVVIRVAPSLNVASYAIKKVDVR